MPAGWRLSLKSSSLHHSHEWLSLFVYRISGVLDLSDAAGRAKARASEAIVADGQVGARRNAVSRIRNALSFERRWFDFPDYRSDGEDMS